MQSHRLLKPLTGLHRAAQAAVDFRQVVKRRGFSSDITDAPVQIERFAGPLQRVGMVFCMPVHESKLAKRLRLAWGVF